MNGSGIVSWVGTVHMSIYNEPYSPRGFRRIGEDVLITTINPVKGSGCPHVTSSSDYSEGSSALDPELLPPLEIDGAPAYMVKEIPDIDGARCSTWWTGRTTDQRRDHG